LNTTYSPQWFLNSRYLNLLRKEMFLLKSGRTGNLNPELTN